MAARDLGHPGVVVLRRRDEAADTHDRLTDEGRGPSRGGRPDDLLDILRARRPAALRLQAERAAVAVGRHRVADRPVVHAAQPPVGMRGQRHGEHRPAVIAVAERHHLRALGVDARGQDGGLDRLGAAVGEEALGRLVPGEDLGQLLGQLHDGDRREQRRDVLERPGLLLEGRHHPRLAVAEGDGDDAAEEVQVTLPVRVLQPFALAANEGQRLLVVGAHAIEVLPILLDDLAGIHGSLSRYFWNSIFTTASGFFRKPIM